MATSGDLNLAVDTGTYASADDYSFRRTGLGIGSEPRHKYGQAPEARLPVL